MLSRRRAKERLLHRTLGGLVAGILFILPGFVSILGLSILYAVYQQTDFVQAVFFGLKAAVLAIVVEAVLRISKRVLKNGTMILLAVASFMAIFFLNVPFPLLILGAGLIGLIGGRLSPGRFVVIKGHEQATAELRFLSHREGPRMTFGLPMHRHRVVE